MTSYLAGEEATHADDAEDVEDGWAHDGPDADVAVGDKNSCRESEPTRAHTHTHDEVHREQSTRSICSGDKQMSHNCQSTWHKHTCQQRGACPSAALYVNDREKALLWTCYTFLILILLSQKPKLHSATNTRINTFFLLYLFVSVQRGDVSHLEESRFKTEELRLTWTLHQGPITDR